MHRIKFFVEVRCLPFSSFTGFFKWAHRHAGIASNVVFLNDIPGVGMQYGTTFAIVTYAEAKDQDEKELELMANFEFQLQHHVKFREKFKVLIEHLTKNKKYECEFDSSLHGGHVYVS